MKSLKLLIYLICTGLVATGAIVIYLLVIAEQVAVALIIIIGTGVWLTGVSLWAHMKIQRRK